eukprot:scaffold7759_cov119-Isochrysis_galbana.AAC.5
MVGRRGRPAACCPHSRARARGSVRAAERLCAYSHVVKCVCVLCTASASSTVRDEVSAYLPPGAFATTMSFVKRGLGTT